jgi:hypothetical protein
VFYLFLYLNTTGLPPFSASYHGAISDVMNEKIVTVKNLKTNTLQNKYIIWKKSGR